MFNPFALPQVSGEEAQHKLQTDPKPYVLDVRQPDEYAEGHIPGSHLIPLGQLGQQFGKLPKDAEIIVVCHSGARSAHATAFLNQHGYRAFNLTGGMMSWRGPVES